MTDKSSFWQSFWDVLLITLLAIIPRITLLYATNSGIESDEAIVGLMAKHILEGSRIPIFYYGQPYMGSLEAILVALNFAVWGISNTALKAVPFLCCLFVIAVTYHFAKYLANRQAGRWAAIYLAISPCAFIVWSLKARGGFIEVVLLGTLATFATSLILANKKSAISNRLILFLGLISGLAWWTNNQVVYYLLPISFVLAYFLIKYHPRSIFRVITLGLGSFFIGSLPFWWHNIFIKPRWQTFEVLFGKTSEGRTLEYFGAYWDTALPMILGARPFWSNSDFFPYATLVIYMSFALLFCAAIFAKPQQNHKHGKEARGRLRLVSKWNLNPLHITLFIAFFSSIPIIFSFSSFGWLSQAPRYLLPMYTFLSIALGVSFSRAWQGGGLTRVLGYTSITVIFSVNLISNYSDGIRNEGEPMVYQGQRVASDHSELYAWLRSKEYFHIFTNYWIGYRTAFETKEEIIFSQVGQPRSVRIPEYEASRNSRPTRGGTFSKSTDQFIGRVFVLVPREASNMKSWLEAFGYCYKETKVGSYIVLDNINRSLAQGKEIEIEPEHVRVFIPPDNLNRAEISKKTKNLFDKDLDTRWASGQPQKAGMAIEIDLIPPTKVGALILNYGRYALDAPRGFRVSYYDEAGKQHEILRVINSYLQRELESFASSDLPKRWEILFPDDIATIIRLELMRDASVFDWSIAELEVRAPSDQDINNKEINSKKVCLP